MANGWGIVARVEYEDKKNTRRGLVKKRGEARRRKSQAEESKREGALGERGGRGKKRKVGESKDQTRTT